MPAAPAAAPRDDALSNGTLAWRRRVLSDLAGYVASGTLALLVAAWVLELWDMSLQVPLTSLSGDATNSVMVVKMIHAGSFFDNPLIGAPGGTDMRDYPFFWDLGQVLSIGALSQIFGDPITVLNFVFIGGFFGIAGNSYLALRWIGLERLVSVLGAVVFCVLPYHFIRGEAQLYVAQYWAVPFGAALVIAVLQGRVLFPRRPGATGLRRYVTWTGGATVAMAVATGVSFSYYAIFTLILLVFAALVRMAAGGGVRRLVTPAIVATLIGVCFGAMLLPTLALRADAGTNPVVGKRLPVESELFALRLTNLVLPIERHRLGALADITNDYVATAPKVGEGPSTPALGGVLSLAFFAGVALLVVGGVAGRRYVSHLALARDAGLLALAAFVMGTTGGGSALFSYFVSAQLRGWSRISVFVAFFAVVVLGALVTWALERPRVARAGRPFAFAAVATLGVVAVFDMTTFAYRPAYEGNLVSWRSDSRIVKAIDDELPPGAMVFQLPYVQFPENPPIFRATDYDNFRGFLHSDDLRWSYGAMKGRTNDWADAVAQRSPAEYLGAVAAAGFRRVWIDTFAYEDGGPSIIAQVRAATGSPPRQRSEDGRIVVFSLDGLDARVARRCGAAVRRAVATDLLDGDLSADGPTCAVAR